jgi:hypothetical protein
MVRHSSKAGCAGSPQMAMGEGSVTGTERIGVTLQNGAKIHGLMLLSGQKSPYARAIWSRFAGPAAIDFAMG